MTQSLGKATMPKDRIELVKASTPLPIDPKEGEDDPISPKSYIRGKAFPRLMEEKGFYKMNESSTYK